MVFVGCAGWNIPRAQASRFADGPSHLARYATRLAAVEINSSFYRPHQTATFARWAATVGDDFRFSVKVPKAITHEARLEVDQRTLQTFLSQFAGLGEKLGVLLVQLPPSLEFAAPTAERFFTTLGEQSSAAIVCEPRHASWFEPGVESLLVRMRVARVAADPDRHPGAGDPGGWSEVAYFRLHGSPHMYYSAYDDAYLAALADRLAAYERRGAQAWCIFDNTAAGAAADNALGLFELLTR